MDDDTEDTGGYSGSTSYNPDGSVTYTDPDGSVYTYQPNGTVTGGSGSSAWTYDPTTGTSNYDFSFGNLFNKLAGKLTNMSGRDIASLAGGLYGLYQGNQSQAPKGYQGSIPQYSMQRTRLDTADPSRRPGGAGHRYFSDVTYVPKGTATTPANTTQVPAATETIDLASGGLAGLAKGTYLRGQTDGMADKIPARIGGEQEAALSHGEFVVPADVVSHLGNGNSDAGAQRLYEMMDRIRKARTGTTKQGKQVNPNKFLPS